MRSVQTTNTNPRLIGPMDLNRSSVSLWLTSYTSKTGASVVKSSLASSKDTSWRRLFRSDFSGSHSKRTHHYKLLAYIVKSLGGPCLRFRESAFLRPWRREPPNSAMNPAAFPCCEAMVVAVRGSLRSRQLYGWRLPSMLRPFGGTVAAAGYCHPLGRRWRRCEDELNRCLDRISAMHAAPSATAGKQSPSEAPDSW